MNQLELIRTKKYQDLTPSDVRLLRSEGILNGFGGGGQSWIVRFLIGLIVGDFSRAIPDYHDFGYWIGGDENRRIKCDEKFYQHMLDDIRRRYDLGRIGKWGLLWKSLVALGAWSAIRLIGRKFFNYG